MRVVILGCGYVGRVLARRLIEDGRAVRGTTTREQGRAAIEATGAEAAVARLADAASLAAALEGAEAAIHLAPPPADGRLEPELEALAAAAPSSLTTIVYGSTTGAFGAHPPGTWIDEDAPTGVLGARGERRLAYEQGLAARFDGLRVVRIAGIYGPQRTVWAAMQRPGFLLFEGGPPTSRIHVDDLARLLAAMLAPQAPKLAVGSDERPAPTLEVAQFACRLMGAPPPTPLTLAQAKAQLSPAALEMRLGGRQCRSKVRPALIGDLLYPTYETGVPAALRVEGLLPEERPA